MTFTAVEQNTNDAAAELAVIAAAYPPGAITRQGTNAIAHAVFTNTFPADVGGAGVYMHLATSLGEAGFYTERFRGSDDIAGLMERRLQAADQITDLLLGWSQAELVREPGYDPLHRFLDVDFRHDMKNAAAYWWSGSLAGGYQTNAPEEFMVRFGQYLWEHGYFKLHELPDLLNAANGDNRPLWLHIQRLVAAKMGVPETSPLPASLAFLANGPAMEASFNQYAATNGLYQARLKQWHEANPHPDANIKPPEPTVILEEPLNHLLECNLFGNPDRLTVQLSLPLRPLHTNGRWDETNHLVLWQTDIESRTNASHIPYSCYASWAQADPAFQAAHFGKTFLTDDDLVTYCTWRHALDAQHGQEWDAFAAQLSPGTNLLSKLETFHFSDEPATATNTLRSDYIRNQFQQILGNDLK